MSDLILYAALGAGLAALLLAVVYARAVLTAPRGNQRMVALSDAIRQGAMAFLRREYIWVAAFVVVIATLIAVLLDWGRPWGVVAYVYGAALSAGAGYFGMRLATQANSRTAEAARTGGVAAALPLAFRGGAVMGFSVAGLGLIGVVVGYVIFRMLLDLDEWPEIITAIALGGSSIALFARIGGGIFTKAADVGADLVGKLEAGIPEDDPRNPAVIADNVGDNVGDVAGMGADLFESYVGALVAPVVYAALVFGSSTFVEEAIVFPLAVGALGMLAAIIGSFLVRVRGDDPGGALRSGTNFALIATAVGALGLAYWIFGEGIANPLGIWLAVLAGLVVGWMVGKISEWFTSDDHKKVKEIARQSQTGPATVIISGIAESMKSAAYSVIVLAGGLGVSYYAGDWALGDGGGVYGVAIAAIGALATVGLIISVDAYGPIADNAGGIARMANLPAEVREVTDTLDSLGNTTTAVAKGFAVASAGVTALALFAHVHPGSRPRSDRPDPCPDPDRAARRRHVPLPRRRPDDQRGRAGRQQDDRRGSPPVPGDPRSQGRRRRCHGRLHGLCRHRHRRSLEGDDHPRLVGGRSPSACRPDRRRGSGRVARRGHRHRVPPRHLHGQCRWRLGQRQEVHRIRRIRREGLGEPQGVGYRRHRRGPVQGHLGTGDEHRHQGDDDRVPGLRLGVHWMSGLHPLRFWVLSYGY